MMNMSEVQRHQVSVTLVRHLLDEDNLLYERRDSGLLDGQEQRAYGMGVELAQVAREEGYQNLYLISSPKRRAVQTMAMMKTGISSIMPDLKVRTAQYYKLGEIDQGVMHLPDSYVPGMYVDELDTAWKIFWEETFSSAGEEQDNQLYRFGDPVSESSGSYKFPKLAHFFSKPGESYCELSLRLYEAALEFGQLYNRERVRQHKTMIAAITHGSPAVIFQMLDQIGRKINEEDFTFPTGKLMRLTWDFYNSNPDSKSNLDLEFGDVRHFVVGSISQKSLQMLEREIHYLKSLLGKQ